MMANSSEAPRYPEAEKLLRDMNNAEVKRLIPTVILLATIAVLGIIGNGIVIHVYRTRYKLSNSKLFIISVAAIDMLSCCVAIPLEIPLLLDQYTFEQVWLCKVSRLFNTLGTCSSSFILLFIAVDRYRKVCKPLAKQITTKIAKFLCVLSVALGLLVSWPAIFVYGRKTFEIILDDGQIDGTECSTADEMSTSRLPFYYTLLFGFLFLAGITSMSILYCFIGFKIRRQARKMSQTFSFRSMSIPMTSSIIDDEARKSGKIVPGALEKYELARKKNESINKKKNSKRKRSESMNDDSWTDKREFELSYEYSDNQSKYTTQQRNGNDKTLPLPNGNVENIAVKENNISIESINSNPVEPETNNEDTCGSTEQKDDVNTKQEDNESKRYSSGSFTSSGEILPNSDRTFRQRLSSIGSRISHAFTRMTSIGSVTADSGIGTMRKTQFLKQARARKTAFVMFVISLAYIISYLPHLVLMVMRQIMSNFDDDLTDSGRAVYKFFLRSYFLNCAINPIIYGVCDSRFRSACADLFGRCRIKRKVNGI